MLKTALNYPPELTKEKERAVRKRAALLTVDKGEVSFNSGKTKVIVIISLEEQRRVLKVCHSEPTSGHFGVTKTYKRMAERVHIFQRKSSRGPYYFNKEIVLAHDLEGTKFLRGGPNFSVKYV